MINTIENTIFETTQGGSLPMHCIVSESTPALCFHMELEQIREQIKEIRTSANLTQREFAKLVGLTKTEYNYFETGERNLTTIKFVKMLNSLSFSIQPPENIEILSTNS